MANLDTTRLAIRTSVTNDNVRLPIHEVPSLVQGANRQNAKLTHGFDSVDSPMKYAEGLRRAGITSKNGRIQMPSHAITAINTVVATVSQPSESEVVKTKSSKISDHQDHVFIRDNAFYKYILFKIDPKAELFPDDTLASTLRKFKFDVAENLTNANQLFKKLGFSRRKSASVDEMKKAITDPIGNAVVSDDIVEYLAKLSKANIVVIDYNASPIPKRANFYHSDVPSSYLLFDSTFTTFPKTFESALDLVVHLQSLVKEKLIPLSRQSLATLKDASKLLGVYKSTASKDAFIEALTPYCS